MFKVGDKLLCKRDLLPLVTNSQNSLAEGRYYQVTYVDNMEDLVYVNERTFSTNSGFSIRNLWRYFYSKQEERKLKLEKLKG